MNTVKQVLSEIVSLFYPQCCDVCDSVLSSREESVCLSCLAEIPRTHYHLEPYDNKVSQIFWGRVPVKAATAWFTFKKGSKYRKLLHLLKYKSRSDIGILLGKHFGYDLKHATEFANAHYIIPVPLHPKKLKIRGYNQSELIAQGLHIALNIPIDTETLVRSRFNQTQTKKNRIERWQNVEEIFTVENNAKLEGKTVVLVDDVITTGATLEACIQALHKVPDIKILVAVLAVA